MGEFDYLIKAIESLEAQRSALGDAVDAALAPLHEALAALEARRGDASIQRKLVTVLFADVVGFTALIEDMDPEVVTTTMNALWSRLDGAVLAEGGTIDKHIGDAIMALFGAPTAREEDPEHAIRAALAMQEQLRAFVEDEAVTSLGRFRNLAMRIGVHTGLVLVGPVGTTQEYTALGDTVNTASRIQSAAQPGKVLISHSTHRHVRGVFDVTPQEPLVVKGKSEPLHVFTVERVRPRSFRVTNRGVVGIETPTIGRDNELAQLRKVWKAAHNSARVVTVVAEAGTGKSRLLFEFTNWLGAQPERYQVYKGRSSEGMERLPYSLLRDLFAFQFDIHEGDTASVAREKLEGGISQIVGPDAAQYIPFIGHLIGFDYSESPLLAGIIGEARQVRDRAYYYITQMFKSLLVSAPVVIFLEDLHWADDSSLAIFQHIAAECRKLPLMIIALSRATLFERYPAWGEDHRVYSRIDLNPLSESDVRRLITIILQRMSTIPESLFSLIVGRADGNPFYVEEVIKMMIEDGVIDTSSDLWQINMERLEASTVPDTLTGVLQARLDGLPGEERKTIQRASVVGRVFWDNAVAHLHEGRDPDLALLDQLPQELFDLQGKELVFERDSSAFNEAQEYIFKHAILRDVAYESVLMQTRRVYHSQTATWLIDRSGERAAEFSGRIGEHFERAEEPELAARWYVRAGKQARATFAAESARDYFQRALALWEQAGAELFEIADEKIAACEELGKVLNWLGRFDEAVAVSGQLREVAAAVGDHAALARSWGATAGAQMYGGDLRAALESAKQSENLAREAGAELDLAVALQLQGWAHFRLGEPEKAQALGEEALAICKKLDHQQQIAKTLNFLGGVAHMQGNFSRAIECLEEALVIFQALDSRDDVVFLFNNLGVIAEARGDYHTAYGRYGSAVNMAREIGNRNAEASCLSNKGGAAVALANYDDAVTDLQQAIELMEGRDFSFSSLIYQNLAQAKLGQGQTDEALTAAAHAMALAKQFEAQDNLAAAWRVLGQIASKLGKPVSIDEKPAKKSARHGARQCFEKSLEIYTAIGMEAERANTLRAWARHELSAGDRAEGERMWQEARDIYARIGAELEAQSMAELPSG